MVIETAVWRLDEGDLADALAALAAKYVRKHGLVPNRLQLGGEAVGRLRAMDMPEGVLLIERWRGCGPRTVMVWRE